MQQQRFPYAESLGERVITTEIQARISDGRVIDGVRNNFYNMRTALLFGASGFIGGYLLQELLNSADYRKVIIVVRSTVRVHHPKLLTLKGDFDTLPTLKEHLVGDDVFIALGTTKSKTPDQKEYYKIDHDYPVRAAKIAKENGARSVSIVSAIGPNIKSKIFYIRLKAEVERDIIALDFQHTHIFRPSMLMGNRQNDNRIAEKIFIKIFSLVNPLLVGSMNKYRGIEGKDVAHAMVRAAKRPAQKIKIYEWKEMHQLIS